LPNVEDGFVRKPSILFVFTVKVKVGWEVVERQGTRLATLISFHDSRYHINTFAFGEFVGGDG